MASAVMMVMMVALLGSFVLLPIYMQGVQGLTRWPPGCCCSRAGC